MVLVTKILALISIYDSTAPTPSHMHCRKLLNIGDSFLKYFTLSDQTDGVVLRSESPEAKGL